MISREQVRMARAALGWTVKDLAAAAGIAGNTVSRFENGTDAFGDTLNRIEKAFVDAGLVMIGADSVGGVGVRFRSSA